MPAYSIVTAKLTNYVFILFFLLFINTGTTYFLMLYQIMESGVGPFLTFFVLNNQPLLVVTLLNIPYQLFLKYIIYYNTVFVIFFLLKNLYAHTRYAL